MIKKTLLGLAALCVALLLFAAPGDLSACTWCDMEGDCRFSDGDYTFCFPGNPGCYLIGECDQLAVAGLTAAGTVPVIVRGMVLGQDDWLDLVELQGETSIQDVIRRTCDGAVLYRSYTQQEIQRAEHASERITL